MRKKIRTFATALIVSLLALAHGSSQSSATAVDTAVAGDCQDFCEDNRTACYISGFAALQPMVIFACDEYYEGCIVGCEIA